MRRIMATGASLALVLAATLAGSSLAAGAEGCASCRPWWHLTSGSRPGVLSVEAGAKGQVVITAANLGDADINGEAQPVTISDTLPSGVEATSIEGVAGQDKGRDGPVTCSIASKPHLTCTYEGILPPFDQLEVRVGVKTTPGVQSGDTEVNELSLSGGGAPSASFARPLRIAEEATPFGPEAYELSPEEEGGALSSQAGSHPFQLTTTFTLNQLLEAKQPAPVAIAKDIRFQWPPGLLGNPSPLSRCTLGQFVTIVPGSGNTCPPQSAVGVAVVSASLDGLNPELQTYAIPVFNIEPAFGEPARFGFDTPVGSVLIDPSIRSAPGDYGITVATSNISQTVAFLSAKVTVWGVPGDPRHDAQRGWSCIQEARNGNLPTPCQATNPNRPPAFLTLPTTCSGKPLTTGVEADSWLDPLAPTPLVAADPPMPTLVGCNRLSFAPATSAQPSTDRASAPSGLDFNLNFHDEGLTSGTGLAQSQMKDAVVTLPEGFTINPSAGVGLVGCTPADYARETLESEPGAGCPNESKLGTVEVTTPLLSTPIHGSLYIAQPYENPFPEPQAGHPNGTLVALYIVLKNPETGVLIKLAGKVTPNPATGQLTTTFADNPQLAFDHFNFHFREGQQAPLISPPLCGTYTTQAQLTPWSDPLNVLTESSSFTITKGFDGGACPAGGAPPFKPQIAAGSLNNNAGAFSPFYLHLTRTDGEQEISGFSTNMPPGLTGDLTGIPFCPEADIETARHKTGAQEEASPSCPAASQIGHTLVGTGAGAVLAYVPGKVYLAGPFHGAPFSLVSVTSAVVGPFDLGTVVLRFGLSIDPVTAQVSVTPTSSEPIPTIIDGIVTHVRDIRVYVDRPNFILDPTSCDPMAIGSTLSSNLGQGATVSSRFQATNCASLAFKPSFQVSTAGKTSRKNGASLHVRLTMPGALGTNANIKYVKVALPRQLPSNLKTIQQACPDHVFEADPANCSAASRIGTATTTTPILPVPLTGPVYFVSHAAREFPDLIAVLQGYGVTIDLRGRTFIAKDGQTTTTFETVPDAPVGVFEMDLPQGPFSALAAPNGVCNVTKTVLVKKKLKIKGRTVTRRVRKTVAAPLTMPTRMIAQNGAVFTQETKIKTVGCPRAKPKSKKGKRRK